MPSQPNLRGRPVARGVLAYAADRRPTCAGGGEYAGTVRVWAALLGAGAALIVGVAVALFVYPTVAPLSLRTGRVVA